MKRIIDWLKGLLSKGHERSVKAKKNIALSVLYKAIGVLMGFAYFPISIEYLGPAKFGIFLTLTSMLDWFTEFDIGIGNGLRNRLGEAITDGDDEKARSFVSTAYYALGSIFSGLTLVIVMACFVIPWSDWLQTEPEMNNEIAWLAIIMFAAFAINFIANLVYQIFYALQQVAKVNFYNLITKTAFLIISLLLLFFTKESLVLYGAAKSMTFAAVPLLLGIYYFRNQFKQYRPSYSLVSKESFRGLFSLGVQFFLIKVSMVIIHQTNNILIVRFVSLESVTEYQAVYKYLSIFLMLFVIMTNQLWAANVEAYRKGDFDWMRKSMRAIIKVWGSTILLTMIMIAISPIFFKLWLRERVDISIWLTIGVALSVSITNWVNMFNLVINGTGKIRLQMYGWLVSSIINIPISIFFAEGLGMGTLGIVLGTFVSMLPLAILSPIQVFKILNKKDRGLWSQ